MTVFFPDMILAAAIGLCLGSFATALYWRVPRGMSWISSDGKAAHSKCPACHRRLSWFDLVPLFSWLALRGRCRYCKAAIGCRYPLIEAVVTGGCILVWLVYGWSLPGIVIMAAIPFLAAMAAIDIERMILPNQLILILSGLGAVFAFVSGGVQGVLWGGLAGFVFAGISFATSWIVGRVLGKEALGFGDVKFFGVAGLWLGLPLLPFFLFISGGSGVLIGLLWKLLWKKSRFPFGPALIASFSVCLLFGRQIQGLFY